MTKRGDRDMDVGATVIRRMYGAPRLDTAAGSSLFHDRDNSRVCPHFDTKFNTAREQPSIQPHGQLTVAHRTF